MIADVAFDFRRARGLPPLTAPEPPAGAATPSQNPTGTSAPSDSHLRNLVPAEFSRPEVLTILRDYYAGIDAADRVEVKLAGHSAR